MAGNPVFGHLQTPQLGGRVLVERGKKSQQPLLVRRQHLFLNFGGGCSFQLILDNITANNSPLVEA